MARVQRKGHVKKRTPKQIAADKKFQSAGTKAAAKKEKSAGPTKAQHQAALKWAAAGRAAQAARRAHKNPAPAKARAAPAPGLVQAKYLPHQAGRPGWIDCSDQPVCASVAVANHLLAQTGFMFSDEDVLALHELAGGTDAGVVIEGVLWVMAHRWHKVAGKCAQLVSHTRVSEDFITAGLVVGMDTPHGGHAVLAHPDGMVSWGTVTPFAGIPREAWALEWKVWKD